MIFADTFGSIFLAVEVAVTLAAVVGYWFLSRKAPRGVVLGVGVLIYIVGVVLTGGDSRLMHGASGVLKLIGFVGLVLGLVDLFRGRVSKSASQKGHHSALKQGLGAPKVSVKNPKPPGGGSS